MKYTKMLSDDGLAIFLFHGVIKRSNYEIRNYTRKHLEKDYFYKIIKALKKEGTPISMDDVVVYHNNGKAFPPKAFAVTFDDGFMNNFTLAAPILKDLKVPATFYLTTDFIENNHMSWIDKIEYCLENTNNGELSFKWDNKKHVFSNAREKIIVLDYLRNHVKRDASINLDSLVEDVSRQCHLDVAEQSTEPVDLKMSWKEVRNLKNDKDFILGGHSHRHVNLAFLDGEGLKSEIDTSCHLFLNNVGIRLKHYSYPEGLSYCYSDAVINALVNRGIVCCPTAEDGINRVDDNLFRLKRITVI